MCLCRIYHAQCDVWIYKYIFHLHFCCCLSTVLGFHISCGHMRDMWLWLLCLAVLPLLIHVTTGYGYGGHTMKSRAKLPGLLYFKPHSHNEWIHSVHHFTASRARTSYAKLYLQLQTAITASARVHTQRAQAQMLITAILLVRSSTMPQCIRKIQVKP